MTVRVAVVQTHPIQYFAPLFREISRVGKVDLKVFFCTDWGVEEYVDPGFGVSFRWDVDLTGGYAHETLPIAARPKQLGFLETDNPAVGEALSRFGPDVLVLSGYAILTNWRALAWARFHGVRVLLVSDSELLYPRRLAVRLAKELVVRGFFAELDGALPIGSANAAYYRHYGLPDESLFFCPIPVDGARFQGEPSLRATTRSELGFEPDDFVFVSVGKYVERKRHVDAVRAWLRLPEENRQRSRLLLVGEGSERANIEAAARPAKERVVLTGFVNQSRMPAMYAVADALLLPSEQDPYGLVASEALFAELPILASDRVGCVGPESAVRPHENGFVCAVGDIDAWTAAMRLLMDDEALRARFAAGSRRIAPEHDVPFAAERFAQAAITVAARPLPSPWQRARRALRTH